MLVMAAVKACSSRCPLVLPVRGCSKLCCSRRALVVLTGRALPGLRLLWLLHHSSSRCLRRLLLQQVVGSAAPRQQEARLLRLLLALGASLYQQRCWHQWPH